MIISFRCKETERIWIGEKSKKLPKDIQQRSLRKLRQLDAAITLDDLKNPPGNCLELLKGDKKDYLSIRINSQWRLCFKWINGEASDVQIIDYH